MRFVADFKDVSFTATFGSSETFNATFNSDDSMNVNFGALTNIGTSDYEKLSNRPSINSIVVTGKKNGNEYLLVNLNDAMLDADIDRIIFGGLNDGE